jgi:hypothetical protein
LHLSRRLYSNWKLPFEGLAVLISAWDNPDVTGRNPPAFFIPIDAADPAFQEYREGVQNRGLPGTVVSDQQIEMRIKLNLARPESVEILDFQPINPHLESSLCPEG